MRFFFSVLIIAIAVNIAYFTNMSEVGLKIIAGLVGIPLFLTIGFMIGFRNTSVNKYTKHRESLLNTQKK